MTIYMGAIILTELLMLTMMFHVLYYPGFAKVEKGWYLSTFIAIFFCAGAEFFAIHFDAQGPSFAVPLTILTVIQFSLSPLLSALFVGALSMHRQAIVAGSIFCLHALIEIVAAPFGWIFYYDETGKYVRGDYYVIYETFFIVSLVFLIVCMIIVGRRFKKRNLSTIIMIILVMAAALLPLILFKLYTDYLGIGLCAALSFIYYNDLIQEDTLEMLVANQEKIRDMQARTISSMASLIENRGMETGEYVRHTDEYVRSLADWAKRDGVYADRMDDRWISMLCTMSPIYDIGKIVVPDRILNKQGKVTAEEFDEIKRHASEGGRVVREVLSGVAEKDYVALASDIATYHHERWDGKGYPKGLAGEDIPLSARIVAIADAFDDLISERCYKKSMSKESAFEIIRQEAGTHFDPKLAEVFLNHKEEL